MLLNGMLRKTSGSSTGQMFFFPESASLSHPARDALVAIWKGNASTVAMSF